MRTKLLITALPMLAAALPLGALLAGSTPAAAASAATGTAKQWVNVRSGPATTAAPVGSLSGGQVVTIVCQEAGSTVKGPGGVTNLWDRLGDGRYVSHSYITPLAGTPVDCAAMPVTGTARQWVNVRSGPATTAAPVGSLSGGQPVTIACQVVGSTVNGPGGASNLWDRIADGRYVAHSYVAANAGTPPKCGATPAPPAPAPTTPTPPPVPAPPAGLTAEQTAFFHTIAGPARQNYTESRVPASVTMAQAILESGWGRGDIPKTAYNFFGAKCSGGVAGAIATGCRSFPTRECNASGCYATTGSFRVYRSVLDSVRDHAVILTKARYAPAFAYSTDPNRFAAEIHKAGYATDPQYTALLTGIMTKYDLYRYDR